MTVKFLNIHRNGSTTSAELLINKHHSKYIETSENSKQVLCIKSNLFKQCKKALRKQGYKIKDSLYFDSQKNILSLQVQEISTTCHLTSDGV